MSQRIHRPHDQPQFRPPQLSRLSGKRRELRLRLEQLESRHLLAGDAWRWFESFDEVSRLKPDELAPSARASDEVGPHELVTSEWIVQLTEDATRSFASLEVWNEKLDSYPIDLSVVSGLGAPGLLLVQGRSVDVADVEATLSASASVEHASLNSLINGQQTPNDPEYQGGLLLGLDLTDASAAWDESIGSMDVVVGVVDGGIDATHPDLFLNIWINQGEIPETFRDQLVDIDGDGLITFYDLNNLKRDTDGTILVSSTGVAATVGEMTTSTPFAAGTNSEFIEDKNGNGRIDAVDLLEDVRWADGFDTDFNGYFDDFFGVNFRAGAGDPFADNHPFDDLGHGTHVAGTIGAVGNNATGVTGVNWQTSLMSLRILDNNNQGDTAAAILAVNYARAMREQYREDSGGRVTEGANVRVLNNSWGQPGGFDSALEASIEDMNDAEILFVAAAGNGNLLGNGVDNDRTPFYPASYESPNVIAVAASNRLDQRASFSNFGDESVDILALGVGVRSTAPGGGYQSANGTSMASPHVAGAAALIWSANPVATVAEVRMAILSAESVDAVVGGSDIVVSGGRLNTFKAVSANVFDPSARLITKNHITAPGGESTEFSIEFYHRDGIDTNTIGDDNLIVTRQWGPPIEYSVTRKPVPIIETATTATATYILNAPGGNWDTLDYGDYVISTREESVASKSEDKSISARNVGSFNVRIEDPSVIYVEHFSDSLESGSLRNAILTANAVAPQSRTIILDSGRYTIDIESAVDASSGFGLSLSNLSIEDPGEWTNESTGDFDISGNITIIGDTMDETVIDAQGIDRVFKVHESGTANLSRLMIRGGKSLPGQGGGGILSIGEVNLDQVKLWDNTALSSDAPREIFGGATAAWHGTLSINNSWITENEADFGGAVYFGGHASGEVQRSTVDQNQGGGLYSFSDQDISVSNSTFSANVGGYGAIANGVFDLFLEGNDDSFSASMSADGRFVAFVSESDNLVPGDINNEDDIFVYDRATELFERVSISSSGAEANSFSDSPFLSADGRFVTFVSDASNLVPGDTNGMRDIFVYDRANDLIERINISNTGEQANGWSYSPSISADGRYVTFSSVASNLLSGDILGARDIFLYDRVLDRLWLTNRGNTHSYAPTVSADGRYIAFESYATNFDFGDTNQSKDIFVYTIASQAIERVSVSNTGEQGNDDSDSPSLSADGRFVVFESDADNLVPGDTNQEQDIFVFDRTMESIERVSVNNAGIEANDSSDSPSISADGRFVTFESRANNLVSGDENGLQDVFVFDRTTKSIERISISDTGNEAHSLSEVPTLNADGRFVAFQSSASNLALGDTAGKQDIFFYDRVSESIEPITFRPLKSTIEISSTTIAHTKGAKSQSAIFGDVRVQDSLFSQNDVLDDLNSRLFPDSSVNNVFSASPQASRISPLRRSGTFPPVHNLISGNPAIDSATPSREGTLDQIGQLREVPDIGAVEAVSASVSGKIYSDANRNGELDAGESGIADVVVSISGETNRIVESQREDPKTVLIDETGHFEAPELRFGSYQIAANSIPGWSVYKPPLEMIKNHSLVGNDESSGASISADGRFVAFSSLASNLVPEDTNDERDVFVFDRNTKLIERVSVNDAGVQGNDSSASTSISADGRFVAFASYADNLVPEDVNGVRDIFVYDRSTKMTERVSVNNDATAGNYHCFLPSLSADGRFVAFHTLASNLVPGDTGFFEDIFVFDRTTKQIERVSIDDSGIQGDWNSTHPSISGDGRYVAFASRATNLVPNDTNNKSDIFVYDRTTKRIKRISVNESGEEGNENSTNPTISVDGRFVSFESAASNLVGDDTNGEADVFLYDLTTELIERVSVSNAGAEGNASSIMASVDANGRFVAFRSQADTLVPNDTNGVIDIFVFDRETRRIERVSVSNSSDEGNDSSSFPSLSSDGRFITFSSRASNLILDDNNDQRDIFVVLNPLAPAGIAVNLEPGEIYSDLNFGLVSDPGTIRGRVFHDVVPNGIFDHGESSVSDTTVFLDLNRNGLRDENDPSTSTDSEGRYAFVDIDSHRNYTVAIGGIVGFELVTPGPTDDFVWDIFLPAGGEVIDRDFALRPSQSTGQSTNSAVSGRIYDDVNKNGDFDSGDIPVANQEVFLDAANFGTRDSNEPAVLTDSQGQFSISNLSARTVAVSTNLDSDLTHVNPLGSDFALQTFPLFAGAAPFGNPQAIAAKDLDDDGFNDIIVALGDANKISVRLNDQHGGFLPDEIDIELGASGDGPTSLVIDQFDSDSRMDVALTANFGSNVVILFNFDPSSRSFASRQDVPVGQEPFDLVAGQFGGDAGLDLVVVNKGNASIPGDETAQVLTNNGGVFVAGPPVPTGGNFSTSIVAGDFTGDASLDVAVIHSLPSLPSNPFGGVTVLVGDGSGGLVLDSSSYREVGAYPTDAVSTDFDGDGRVDIAVANFATNSISVLRGQVDGTLLVQPDILGTASGAFDIAIGDIDNDGDIDLISSNLEDRNISIFRNIGVDPATGDVRFEPLENVGLGQFSLAQRMPLVVANFDNDSSGPGETGTLDIVAIPAQTDTLHLLTNTLVDGAHRVALTGLNAVSGLDFIVASKSIPPTVDPISNPLPIVEDAGEQTIVLTGIAPGRDGNELRFLLSDSEGGLIDSLDVNYVPGSTTADLRFTTLPYANGVDTIEVVLEDAGADGDINTVADNTTETRRVTITVQPVNNPPTFDLAPLVTATQKVGAFAPPDAVLTNLLPGGGSDESGQVPMIVNVVATDPTLFTVQPQIDAQGRLMFTPDPNKYGVTLVNVTVTDDGGKENGGDDTTTKAFVVNVLPFNDPPSIALAGDLVSVADPSSQTLSGFASSFHPGPGDDDAGQTLADYLVSVDRPELFATTPDIDNDGNLTFIPAGAGGEATVSVQVRDSGSSDGGNDLSPVQTFRITLVSRPEVESVLINGGDSSRSLITSLSVQFAGQVDHDDLAGGFTLTHIETGVQVGTVHVAASDSDGKTSALLTFSGASTLERASGNSLIDGNYRLDVAAIKVTTPLGAFPMADDFQFGGRPPGQPNNDAFFRLFGDTDGDGKVDGKDLGRFGSAFLKQSLDPDHDANLDYDGDGDVDGLDYQAIARRYLARRN